MEKVHLLSLGCPKNLVDSELMLGALTQAGFEVTMDPGQAQVLIVNTCTFIEPAKKESIDAILEAAELKNRAPGSKLVVAGCLSQRYGAELRSMLPEVDLFVGTGDFLSLPGKLRDSQADNRAEPFYAGAAHLLPARDDARVTTTAFYTAYMKVSEGCDHKCSFCIIPRIRGRHESRPAEELVHEARLLASRGVRELNLIAQDLTAYGRDLAPRRSLAGLLRELSAVEGIHWIRLLYCYPNFVTDELLDTIAELPQVARYIDIPLQHADDGVLRAMRRERSADSLRKLIERIRRRVPGVAIRTSFIVGFPGETEAAFGRLLDFVREARFERVGVFTYSREENTAGYDLPAQVPEKVKRERRTQLMVAQAEISRELNQRYLGQEVEVLVENDAAGRRLRGRTAGQAPEIDGTVLMRGVAEAGEFVRVRIDKALAYDLHGQVLDVVEPERRLAIHA